MIPGNSFCLPGLSVTEQGSKGFPKVISNGIASSELLEDLLDLDLACKKDLLSEKKKKIECTGAMNMGLFSQCKNLKSSENRMYFSDS